MQTALFDEIKAPPIRVEFVIAERAIMPLWATAKPPHLLLMLLFSARGTGQPGRFIRF